LEPLADREFQEPTEPRETQASASLAQRAKMEDQDPWAPPDPRVPLGSPGSKDHPEMFSWRASAS